LNKKERIQKISELLKRDFPIVDTPLFHKSALQLVMATLMSAQTLDASVNKVTPSLFERYKTLEDFANANPEEVGSFIRTVNYHRTKSRNVIKLAQKLLADFDGVVPHTIDELTKLPGVGRKTANVVISEWFSKPLERRGSPNLKYPAEFSKGEDVMVLPEGFVVDTHVIRTSNRLGLTKHKDPEKIEQDLMKIFPRNEWNEMSLRLIFHGRNRCKARDNQCCNDVEWGKLCVGVYNS